MKNSSLIIFIFLLSGAGIFANNPDSMEVYFYNPYKTHKIYIYNFKIRNQEGLINTFRTDDDMKKIRVEGNQFGSNGNIDFYIFIKNKYWFGGRWINISTSIQKDKRLLIFYSVERKRKFCYDFLWFDPDNLAYYMR